MQPYDPAPVLDAPDVTTQLLVRVAGWAVMAIGGAIALLLALDPVGQSTSRILFNLGAGLVGGLALVLARLERWWLAAHVLVWGVWCFVTLVTARNGGLNGPNLLSYPVLIVLSGWMLGTRATVLLVAVTGVLFGLFFWAEAQGWVLQVPQSTPWAHGVYLAGILVLTAAATLLSRRHYMQRVEDAQRTAHELAASEAQLRKLLRAVEQSPESIVITDLNERIEYVNEAFVRRTGYLREEVLGQDAAVFSSRGMEAAQRQGLRETLASGKVWAGEQASQRKDGAPLAEAVVVAPIRQTDGSISHYVEFRQDITERRRAAEEIHRLTRYDALTGLPNRAMLVEHLDGLKVGAGCSQTTVHALLLLDLDRFTVFNDARGSEMGDRLLCAMALRLSRLLPVEGMLVRVAGDEFALVLHGLGDDAAMVGPRALAFAAQVQAAIGNSLRLQGDTGPIQWTASMGITLYPQGPSDQAHDALRRASMALHRAKAMRGGQLAFFEQEMGQAAEQRFQVERELRQAIGAGELRLYLQSQVDLQGRTTGAEVLVRWQHPRDGLVMPGVFIPVAESSDLIVLLGRWVLEQACALLARPAFAQQGVRLSVNLSARQFRQPGFVQDLRALLERSGADPALLTLEVTEGLVIEDFDDVVAKMRELVALGVEFSLDDFGTGYSSLAYLKRLPIQEIKIDRSFVRDACTNADDGALVEAILSVARHFSLRVVAEGVETQEQASYLTQRSPAIICQGFLYCRPQPQEEWLQRLT
jgi:diguanylate cyclase (GGDEF)-like protein/PAS domain S-box-containing protein